MCDPILRLIGVWDYSLIYVLCFRIIAGVTATGVDMHVSPHRFAYHVTQHRRAIVIRREFASFQLKAGSIWPIDSPPGAGHGPMARFVFVLRMS
jgi:hypothetical protein